MHPETRANLLGRLKWPTMFQESVHRNRRLIRENSEIFLQTEKLEDAYFTQSPISQQPPLRLAPLGNV